MQKKKNIDCITITIIERLPIPRKRTIVCYILHCACVLEWPPSVSLKKPMKTKQNSPVMRDASGLVNQILPCSLKSPFATTWLWCRAFQVVIVHVIMAHNDWWAHEHFWSWWWGYCLPVFVHSGFFRSALHKFFCTPLLLLLLYPTKYWSEFHSKMHSTI